MRKIYIFLSFIFCGLLAFKGYPQQTIVWSENFESGTSDWLTTTVWQIGTPIGGPNASHGGLKCAATDLDNYYPQGVETRLVKLSSFVVPDASQNPRLRFWHWFANSWEDYGSVQLKINGTNDWITISPLTYTGWSYKWTNCSVDLINYAGQTVQIAFFFHSDYYGEDYGWYIDDVSLVTGPYMFNNPEGWEGGIGDWYAEKGTWEVGVPTSGPVNANTGQKCAGTILDGIYAGFVDSRLTSPPFVVPPASQNPRLRFWHWFANTWGDYGSVQLKVNGTNDWITISPLTYTGWSYKWTNCSVDLINYAGQTVQIAFFFHSDDYAEDNGWYIDDVSLVTGPYMFNNPEGWEGGIGDWYAEKGTWEVGVPTSDPVSAYTGQKCAGTILNGSYAGFVDSRLTSPPFVVPQASENPRIRFWHWFANSWGDYGSVQLKVNGTND